MCGIAGVMVQAGGASVEADELRRMAGALRHRGPDGYGLYLDDHAGLAHARLSIIDRDTGAQPMGDENGAVWITFNGEIFNYIELREELEALGRPFRTRSDTEVIIQAYRQWGDGAWERLNGQFAFALRDLRDQSLRLVRDRVGIAPLHYALVDGALVFASEAKAIFASGRVAPKPDAEAVAAAFMLWSVPSPGTVFSGVQVVPPGTAIRFGRDLRQRRTAYHTLSFDDAGGAPDLTLDEAAERLTELLARAVRIRLRADVPVGAYLSGGVDSSMIARLVQRADSSPLQTFSVRFADARYDEGGAQQRMARELGAAHHEIVVTPEGVGTELMNVVRHCETPLTRTAPAPMFALSALVRDMGMRVVLTGEGADEFLGGYDIFKEDRVRRFWARRPGSSLRPSLLRRVHPYVANSNGAMWQEFFRRGLGSTDDEFYSHRLRWENNAWTLRFLAPGLRTRLDDAALAERVRGALPDGWAAADPLARAQQIEIATFMTPYLLASQGDRATMSHGVEGRYPFLDPDVIRFAASLPTRLKLCGLREKVVLRAAARRVLPREVADRRKWPYRAPIASALFGEGAPEYVRELLSPGALGECPLIDARSASALFARVWSDPESIGEREEMAAVGLLTLQIWRREFIDGRGTARTGYTEPPGVYADRRGAVRLTPSALLTS